MAMSLSFVVFFTERNDKREIGDFSSFFRGVVFVDEMITFGAFLGDAATVEGDEGGNGA